MTLLETRMRIAIYARSRGYIVGMPGPGSIEDQIKTLRSWSLEKGHQVAGTYTDSEVGANDMQRPGFQRMIMDAHAPHRPYEALVACDMDRFFRNTKLLIEYGEMMQSAGVIFLDANPREAPQLSLLLDVVRELTTRQPIRSQATRRSKTSAPQKGRNRRR